MIRRTILPVLGVVALFEGLKLWLGADFAQAYAFGFMTACILAFWEAGAPKAPDDGAPA